MNILELALPHRNDNDSESIVAQLRACAEDVFHSIPLESNYFILRLFREQWLFKRNDSVAQITNQEEGHEGLIESGEPIVYDRTLIRESFMRATQTIPATGSSSSLPAGIPDSELRYILPGSKLLAYNLRT